jgi:hypothetical protein
MSAIDDAKWQAALEAAIDHGVDQLHGLLDRLNGTVLVMTTGGFVLVIPERGLPTAEHPDKVSA